MTSELLMENNRLQLVHEVFYFYSTWILSLNLDYSVDLSGEIEFTFPNDFLLFDRATVLAEHIFPDLAERGMDWFL
jgi:hypothetical protein